MGFTKNLKFDYSYNMIETKQIFEFFKKNNIDFFSGVPDSILKKTSHFLEKKNIQNIVAANEGGAAAICMGYHLSTRKIPCLYLQNSGLGNAINPLASISHKKVYSIPMLILIGWRGAPGEKDESQHMVKGEITKNLLKNLNINYCILKEKSDFKKLKLLLRYSRLHKKPVACLIKKNTFFNKFEKRKQKKLKKNNLLTREIFITELLNSIKSSTKIIAFLVAMTISISLLPPSSGSGILTPSRINASFPTALVSFSNLNSATLPETTCPSGSNFFLRDKNSSNRPNFPPLHQLINRGNNNINSFS